MDTSTNKQNLISEMSQAELNPAEKRLVALLLSLSEYQLATLSTDKICEQANASRATIGRLAKRFGCSGQKELRAELLKASRAMKAKVDANPGNGPDISADDTPSVIAEKILQNASVRSLRFSDILAQSNVLEEILTQIRKARRIIAFGAGQSSIAALDLYQRLLRIGMPISFDLDCHTQLVQASLMTADDLGIVISYSGMTREMIGVAQTIKERGAKLMVVTAKTHSELNDLADLTLLMPPGTGLYGMDAAMNRLMQIMFNEVIYQCLVIDSPDMLEISAQVDSALDRGKLFNETKRIRQ